MTHRKAPIDGTCHVLREHPQLAQDISPGRKAQAEETCVAQALNIARGRWTLVRGELPEGVGLLVLDGLLLRRVSVEGRFGAELLGSGDLIRPWGDPAEPALRRATTWRAIRPTRLAVLDDRAVESMTRYPEIMRGLLERSVERSRRLALNMAIVHHPRVEIRLRMLFWHLADRWGRAGDAGHTILPLRLSHSVLADLVAAQRPTVSSALSELASRAIVLPTPDGWLLLAGPPTEAISAADPRRGSTRASPGEAPRSRRGHQRTRSPRAGRPEQAVSADAPR